VQTHVGHMLFNVRKENLSFYKDLLSFLGWKTLYASDEMFGAGDTRGASLWFGGEVKEVANDYDGPGLNHLAISTETQADVDATVEYLRGRNVQPLFETPQHRPEFSQSEDQTYYQVMFETPDRILLEVVYTGPKS
jgi:catechol 2,3-dioxygenase-like lactoylglutathione lyase family enzyme